MIPGDDIREGDEVEVWVRDPYDEQNGDWVRGVVARRRRSMMTPVAEYNWVIDLADGSVQYWHPRVLMRKVAE